jgi:hypothetical protein
MFQQSLMHDLARISTVALALAALTACIPPANQTFDKSGYEPKVIALNLTGGFTDNEGMYIYAAVGQVYRTGVIKATGDRYSYEVEPRDIEVTPVDRPYAARAALSPQRPNWLGGCSTDKLTDKDECKINIIPQARKINGGLHQSVSRDGDIKYACILGHDFPGRRGMIRIDGNPAIETNNDGCVSGRKATDLQSQLIAGSLLITRRVEWPYSGSVDKEMIISGGFASARALYKFTGNADLKALFSGSE